MGGSCIPIGLCLMLLRPWSACNWAFLTMKRSVQDCVTCITADYDCFDSACLFLLILQILSYNPVLGAFLIGSCIVFMTFVVLNLFISVILVAFSQEQIHHKVTHPCRVWKVCMLLMSVSTCHCSRLWPLHGHLLYKTQSKCLRFSLSL